MDKICYVIVRYLEHDSNSLQYLEVTPDNDIRWNVNLRDCTRWFSKDKAIEQLNKFDSFRILNENIKVTELIIKNI